MNNAFGRELRRIRSERGLSLAQLAKLVPCQRGYIGQLEHGERRPSPEFARKLDGVLGVGSQLANLAMTSPAAAAASPDDDEFGAYELARRAAASDVGNVALAGLEEAADRLAVAYQGTAPRLLLPDIRRHLDYAGHLIDKRATLAQRRRLLAVGGWLSLLAATVDVDLHQRHVAGARLATAKSLAEQTANSELAAWCLETQAWDALTEGRYKLAVDLAQAAQDAAPVDGSAFIQATAQEGRAWARLGDDRATRDALRYPAWKVEQTARPAPAPTHRRGHRRRVVGSTRCGQTTGR